MTNTYSYIATCLKKLEMVMVTGRNVSMAVPMSSVLQLSRLSGVPLFGRSSDDFRKLSYGENPEPVENRFRSAQHSDARLAETNNRVTTSRFKKF